MSAAAKTAREQTARSIAADAKHIAAASPDVVLALVEAARKLERIRAIMDGDGSIMGDRNAIREVLNGR